MKVLYRMICTNCNKGTRFFAKRKHEPDDMVIAAGCLNPDGTQPKDNDLIPPCPECGTREKTWAYDKYEEVERSSIE